MVKIRAGKLTRKPMCEKAESANSLPFEVYFHMGAYFCMGACKHNLVVAIKMDAYILAVFCH